ncbi:hypothetical protein [Tuwongella immobilis]|uniref:Uncharacterized protein n=1 Tax=Tuwongella immobilis TaxID=692036 RepID=A0A6C2YTR8_9BACT|nr:hypothetical protein [Tuwongella immobilis]VIP04747.1 unnamed protein product [Tuwongella immobilis]VTS06853.1 unnamed protein product [Tuwongella immobilis]
MFIVRMATVYEPEIDALPDEFRTVLTEQDILAIRTGPEYFATLADADAPSWLKKLLAKCAESWYELQFYATGNAPYRPYFRFQFLGEPAISLPRSMPLRPDMPAFLRRLYGVIGAFRENGFDVAGGLRAGDRLAPVTESGMWVEPGGPIDPAQAVPFLETLSGSQLCYLPDGSGAWLEACQFRPIAKLESEVARYFQALLKGKRI